MKYLDLTLPTPEANIACDEALLDLCEQGALPEILRVWESPSPFVVIGYANEVAREVKVSVCRDRKIAIIRRCSGGGTVVQGPGCLNFALCLEIERHDELTSITGTNQFIMERQRAAIEALLPEPVEIQGHTDLAIRGRKFSGNAQRRKRAFLLFHGTVLFHFDLALVQELLLAPSRQPAYRGERSHLDFLCNLPLAPTVVKEAWRRTWGSQDVMASIPQERIQELIDTKYSRDEWNLRC